MHPDAHRSKSHESAPVSPIVEVRSTHDRPLLAARSAVRRSQWHLELLKFAPGAGLPAQPLRKFPIQNAGGPRKSAPTENPCGTRVDSRGTNLTSARTARSQRPTHEPTHHERKPRAHEAKINQKFLTLLKPYTTSIHQLRSKSTHLTSTSHPYTTSCLLLLLARCNYRTLIYTSKNHR